MSDPQDLQNLADATNHEQAVDTKHHTSGYGGHPKQGSTDPNDTHHDPI